MTQRRNVRRFSISLPPTLVEEFDETWRNMRYENRSKAVHDAIRGFITEVQWMRRDVGAVVGVVLILRYIDKPGLIEDIAELKHSFRKIITSIQQQYLDENKMLETLAVEGDVEKVKRLSQALMAKKGVKHVKTCFVTP